MFNLADEDSVKNLFSHYENYFSPKKPIWKTIFKKYNVRILVLSIIRITSFFIKSH